MQHSSRLRYIDADQVGSEVVDFDGLKVRRPEGEKLGEVDGFIIDPDGRRAYYLVVDSGGWFKSRQFLVPIGHARMDDDGDALVLDITRDAIHHYPEFDRDSFERMNDEELRAYQGRFDDVCCGDIAESHDHFTQPSWWRTEYYSWDIPAGVGTAGDVPPATPRFADRKERVTRVTGDGDRDALYAREEPVGTRGIEGGDVSPHLGGRAQPGDVIGLETGGERTRLGDTTEEENERRRAAEHAAGKENRDESRDRGRD